MNTTHENDIPTDSNQGMSSAYIKMIRFSGVDVHEIVDVLSEMSLTDRKLYFFRTTLSRAKSRISQLWYEIFEKFKKPDTPQGCQIQDIALKWYFYYKLLYDSNFHLPLPQKFLFFGCSFYVKVPTAQSIFNQLAQFLLLNGAQMVTNEMELFNISYFANQRQYGKQ